MNNKNHIPLLGESPKNSDWILPVGERWIPEVKKPRKWGTNLGEPRKQWQRPNQKNHTKGGIK